MSNIVFLSTPQVEKIHDEQIELHGGLPGVRDRNMLESAVSAPKATFDAEFLHKTIYEMAAAYFIGLASNHAFNEGNKRTATMSVFVFLYMNGVYLEIDDDELVEYAVRVVTERLSNQTIAKYLEDHAVAYQRKS